MRFDLTRALECYRTKDIHCQTSTPTKLTQPIARTPPITIDKIKLYSSISLPFTKDGAKTRTLYKYKYTTHAGFKHPKKIKQTRILIGMAELRN